MASQQVSRSRPHPALAMLVLPPTRLCHGSWTSVLLALAELGRLRCRIVAKHMKLQDKKKIRNAWGDEQAKCCTSVCCTSSSASDLERDNVPLQGEGTPIKLKAAKVACSYLLGRT